MLKLGPVLSRRVLLCACMTQLGTWWLQVDAGKANMSPSKKRSAKRGLLKGKIKPPPKPSTHPDGELPNPAVTPALSSQEDHVATTTSGLDNTGTATPNGSTKVGGPGPLQHSTASHKVAT